MIDFYFESVSLIYYVLCLYSVYKVDVFFGIVLQKRFVNWCYMNKTCIYTSDFLAIFTLYIKGVFT